MWTYSRTQIADQAQAFLDLANAEPDGSAAQVAYIEAATSLGHVIIGRVYDIIGRSGPVGSESPVRTAILQRADALLVQANQTANQATKRTLINEAGMLGKLAEAQVLHFVAANYYTDEDTDVEPQP